MCRLCVAPACDISIHYADYGQRYTSSSKRQSLHLIGMQYTNVCRALHTRYNYDFIHFLPIQGIRSLIRSWIYSTLPTGLPYPNILSAWSFLPSVFDSESAAWLHVYRAQSDSLGL